MDKQWLKLRVHIWLLYFKTKPFFTIVALMVLVLIFFTILGNTMPFLFTRFTMTVMVIVAVHGTQKCVVGAYSRQREIPSKEAFSLGMSMHQECSHKYSGDGWERHSRLSCIKEEALLTAAVDNLGLGSLIVKDEAMEEIGPNVEEAHGNALCLLDSKAGEACLDLKCSHQASTLADVPDLEECSTSSEEGEVCKSALEATSLGSGPHEDTDVLDSTLQSSIKATSATNEEVEHSVDKHQILPPDSCKQCHANTSRSDGCDKLCNYACDVGRVPKATPRKLVITDAELQKASSEFYTLEGDVLWSKSDLIKKPPGGKRRGASASDVLAAAAEATWDQSLSSGTFSSFSSRAQQGGHFLAAMPVISKVLFQTDAMKVEVESETICKSALLSKAVSQTNGKKVEVDREPICKSAEMQQVMNEDVLLDAELRAIAFRSVWNRGEESNYMSTAGSFRDFVGSFREAEACWPEYAGMKEEDVIAGCCDDHAKPCISHCRSRSKVLQSDPLLSKASLIREQEFMDVLWQEYNEEMRRQRHKEKEGAQKQREGTAHGCSSGGDAKELPDDGDAADCSGHLHGDEYVMKLNTAPGRDQNGSSHCRLGCDQVCWHMAKARGYHRRRHFVRICRVLREFGLKQCMQSSKVDN